MKKILMCLGLAALLAGCASNDNGMGGTSDESIQSSQSSQASDQSMKTDTFNKNNANSGTDPSIAPSSNPQP